MKEHIFIVYFSSLCLNKLIIANTPSESDFSFIVKSKYFVDKTLLLKDFLRNDPNGTRYYVVTAPIGFGKSSVIDMVRKFIGMSINTNGRPVSNENHALFCDQPLAICKQSRLFSEHFGKYPVIHIDYQRLGAVRNVEEFERAFRLILKDTFIHHQYLAQNVSLFRNITDKQTFIKHCSVNGVKLLKQCNIIQSFRWLSQLLNMHFGKTVIVLLDNYDAYMTGNLLDGSVYKNEIIDVMQTVIQQLFVNNSAVNKALLTGVLLLRGSGASPICPQTREFRFLGDHEFSSYFGLTEEETGHIIRRQVNSTNLNMTRQYISRHYDGYQVENRNIKLYATRSIIDYFDHGMKIDGYWIKMQRIDSLIRMFNVESVIYVIKELVFSMEIHVEQLDAFTKEILYEINEINDKLNPRSDREEQWFISLLFDLGFLTFTQRNQTGCLKISFTIPNIEIYPKFCEILKQTYLGKYKLNKQYVTDFVSAVESLNVNITTKEDYKMFYRATQKLVSSKSFCPYNENDMQSFFLICLQGKLHIVRPTTFEVMSKVNRYEEVVCTSPTVEDEINHEIITAYKYHYRERIMNEQQSRIEIMVVNNHETAIILEPKFKRFDPARKILTMRDLALDAIHQIVLSCGPGLKEDPLLRSENAYCISGKLYIGLAYDQDTRDICMAFYNPDRANEPIIINSSN